jgi:hypothetical protein
MADKGRVDAKFIKKLNPSISLDAAKALAKKINNDGRIDNTEMRALKRYGSRTQALAKFIGNKPVILHDIGLVAIHGVAVYSRCKMPSITQGTQLKGVCMYNAYGDPATEFNTSARAARKLEQLDKAGVSAYPTLLKLVSKGRISKNTIGLIVGPRMAPVLKKLKPSQKKELATKILQYAKNLDVKRDAHTLKYIRIIVTRLTGSCPQLGLSQ